MDADTVREELAAAEAQLVALETEYAGHDYEEIERAIEWAHARLAILDHH